MQASVAMALKRARWAITMAPVRSYVKVSGGVMCERTHTVGSLTTAIVGSLATTGRASHGHPRDRPDRSAQVRTEEVGGGRGKRRRAGQAVADGPAHARRCLTIRLAAPGSPYPDMCRASHRSTRAYPHLSARADASQLLSPMKLDEKSARK